MSWYNLLRVEISFLCLIETKDISLGVSQRRVWGGRCSCRVRNLKWDSCKLLSQERLRAWSWAVVQWSLSLKSLHVLNDSGMACITSVCSVCRSESSSRLKAGIYFSSLRGKCSQRMFNSISSSWNARLCYVYFSAWCSCVLKRCILSSCHSQFSINMHFIWTENRINFIPFVVFWALTFPVPGQVPRAGHVNRGARRSIGPTHVLIKRPVTHRPWNTQRHVSCWRTTHSTHPAVTSLTCGRRRADEALDALVCVDPPLLLQQLQRFPRRHLQTPHPFKHELKHTEHLQDQSHFYNTTNQHNYILIQF